MNKVNAIIFLLAVSVLLATVKAVSGTACADHDTSACQLMNEQRPDLCTDPVLAKTACPKFCKLCPILCYHCNTSLTTTKNCDILLCGEGEVCMKKEQTSYVDGHSEYQLSCELKEHCDGTALTTNFGKREIKSRDISLSCCDSDLCNDIMVTTTTEIPQTTTVASSCRKDVTVLVETGHIHHPNAHSINLLLTQLIDRLNVGVNDVLVSLVTFNSSTQVLWDLDSYTDKATLQDAINKVHFLIGDHLHNDLGAALSYLIQNTGSSGNRANADDVLIMITDKNYDNSTVVRQLHDAYSQVFVHGILHGGHANLATDHAHLIHLRYGQNNNHDYAKFVAMICK